MANGESDFSKKVLASLAGTGVLGVVATGMLSISQSASIALDVAEQHGQEILLIRGEMSSIRTEMLSRTEDRFTSNDGKNLERYIERRFMSIDKALARMEADLKKVTN